MTDRAIAASDVHKSFGEKHALRGFDLDVEQGSIVGFVGPNGAGKSTFLRVLVGLIEHDSGDVTALGLDPRTSSLEIRRRCCYLPGETSVYQNMTGAEFLEFAIGFYPSRRQLPDFARELFDLPMNQKVRAYSAGMKQKLALLGTLTPDVELYLLDEPDRALDATARLLLRELLREMRSAGKSVLMSTHHLAEIDATADRTVFLFDGRHVPDDDVARARQLLRRQLRLRLEPDTALPDGTECVERQPDGMVRVRTSGEPLEWLRRIPATSIRTAEVGATRLEDLYSVLTEEHAADPGRAS